jgi:hypothetical protein
MTAVILLQQMICIEMILELCLVPVLISTHVARELLLLVNIANVRIQGLASVGPETAHVTQQTRLDDVVVTTTVSQENAIEVKFETSKIVGEKFLSFEFS